MLRKPADVLPTEGDTVDQAPKPRLPSRSSLQFFKKYLFLGSTTWKLGFTKFGEACESTFFLKFPGQLQSSKFGNHPIMWHLKFTSSPRNSAETERESNGCVRSS